MNKNRIWQAIFLAVVTAFLAAQNAAAETPRLITINKVRFQIAGDGWSLEYGSPYVTLSSGPIVRLFASAQPDRAYFSHGNWVRLLDSKQGIVLRRWRFPGNIIRVSEQDRLLQVEMTTNFTRHPNVTRTVTVDPENPVIPYWPLDDWAMQRVPELEAGAIGLIDPGGWGRTGGVNEERIDQSLSLAREAVRRDPLAPWLKVGLGAILKKLRDPEAHEMFRQAVQGPSGHFTELFPIARFLDFVGEPDLAREAFERGLRNFYETGNDPRQVRNPYMFPKPAHLTSTTWRSEGGLERIERLYRVSPSADFAPDAWNFLADRLEKDGQQSEATAWRGRAEEAKAWSTQISEPALWRVFSVPVFSGAAILAYLAALFFKYLPQTRLAAAGKRRGFARGFTLFGLLYASRTERTALLLLGVFAAMSLGVSGGVLLQWDRRNSAPVALDLGSYAGPATIGFLEHDAIPSVERDLLLAVAYQQDGQPDRAESLYRKLPEYAESWNNLGVLLAARGLRGESNQAFMHALTLDSNLHEAALNLGHPAHDTWTDAYRKYVPNRPMIATPRPDRVSRALRGESMRKTIWMSWSGLARFHQSDSPEPEVGKVLQGGIGTLFWILLFVLFLFAAPVKDVTQTRGRIMTLAEMALPGTCPKWGWMGGLALAAWIYAIFQFRTLSSSTPYFSSWGIGVPEADIERLADPGLFWTVGAPILLFLINLGLVYWNEHQRSATVASSFEVPRG